MRIEPRTSRHLLAAVAIAAVILTSGCVKKLAVGALANAMAAGGDVYASDDDPELIRDALPFALKTLETLLAEIEGGQLLRRPFRLAAEVLDCIGGLALSLHRCRQAQEHRVDGAGGLVARERDQPVKK